MTYFKIWYQSLKKIENNDVIYVENKNGFKNALTKDEVKKKTIILAIIQTGYVLKNVNRNVINNKRLFIQISNEDKILITKNIDKCLPIS